MSGRVVGWWWRRYGERAGRRGGGLDDKEDALSEAQARGEDRSYGSRYWYSINIMKAVFCLDSLRCTSSLGGTVSAQPYEPINLATRMKLFTLTFESSSHFASITSPILETPQYDFCHCQSATAYCLKVFDAGYTGHQGSVDMGTRTSGTSCMPPGLGMFEPSNSGLGREYWTESISSIWLT